MMTLTDHTGKRRKIESVDKLIGILSEHRVSEQFVFILDFYEHGILTVGVGKTDGFIEFMASDEYPPYLIARQKGVENITSEKFVSFSTGGTTTPIPIEFCIPMDLVENIIKYFFESKELPSFVNWVEI